ncbi:glycosyltransferase family 4 protein [Pontibacter kalidii]|uniref:glycosyltransferase family 4 protein n=1 Tax=Pontibacter kalidii TaxID=2592049 RepID=UPI0022555939|nr:glycosyltransferase family 4 protein [Pontibacter kalidii]
MKILFVAPRFHTNQYQLVKTLQEHHHQVYFHVSYLGPTEDYSLLIPKNFRQSRVSVFIEKIMAKRVVRRPCYYYYPKILDYWEGFKALKPDLVIIRDPYTLFSLIAAFCAYFLKVKVIFYTQEDLYRPRSRFTYLKQLLTIRFFKAAWITPIKESNDNGKGVKHMYYFPLPIPTQPLEKAHKKGPIAEPALLMIGKYHQDRKKHLLLLEAVNQLKHKYRFKLTIVGECMTKGQKQKYKTLEDRIRQLGLSDIVRLKANVPFHDMDELYDSHHVFVLPSVNEPYSISVLEALAHGLPVICTDSCGSKVHVRDGWNGYITASSSLEALNGAISNFLSDHTKIYEMSGNALFYVQEHLSNTVCYRRLEEIVAERFSSDLEASVLTPHLK